MAVRAGHIIARRDRTRKPEAAQAAEAGSRIIFSRKLSVTESCTARTPILDFLLYNLSVSIKFWKKKPEAFSLEGHETKIEKPRFRWLLWKKRNPELPVAERVYPDLRTRNEDGPDTVAVPSKTVFTTKQQFRQPEVPSMADDVVAAGADVAIAGGELAGALLTEGGKAALVVGEEAVRTAEGAAAEIAGMFSPEEKTMNEMSEDSDRQGEKELPVWAQKEVAPESVDIHSLPLNWESLEELGMAISRLTGTRIDLTALKPPSDVRAFLPAVASVIANRRNPEIPVEMPTWDQLQEIKPFLATLHRWVGFFSAEAAQGLEKYAERTAKRQIQSAAEKAIDVIEFIGSIKNPKLEFLWEMTVLYGHLHARQNYQNSSEEVPIEEKFASFIVDLRWAQKHPETYKDTSYWLNTRDFPLLLKIPEKFGISLGSKSADDMGVAGSEFMQGLEKFLRQKGVTDLGRAPQPHQSTKRMLAEQFASEDLNRVRHLPDVLSQIYEALPTSGEELKNKIYEIIENICVLHQRGHSSGEIVKHMFPGMRTLRMQSPPPALQQKFEDDTYAVGGFCFIAGWVAFFCGASWIWIPVGFIGGLVLGAVSSAATIVRWLAKETER